MEHIKEREEREKEEAIDLLKKQMVVEGKLINLYEETVGSIQSRPVKHLLRMITLDSRKHVDICQVAIEVLQGEDVLSEEKDELIKGLQRHIELEKESVDRAKKILKNTWIRENKGLSELIKKLRDDEKKHHKALKKLTGKAFFRLDPNDFIAVLRDMEFLEERYKRRREFERKGGLKAFERKRKGDDASDGGSN